MWRTTVAGEVEKSDRGVMRKLLQAAALATTLLAALAPPAGAAPCVGHPEVSLFAPPRLAFERLGTVVVDGGDPFGPRVLSARLDYVDAYGQSFFSHVFPAEALDRDVTSAFPIQLSADTGQVAVRLTGAQQRSYEYKLPDPPCEVFEERTVRPSPGQVPRVGIYGNRDLSQDSAAWLDFAIDAPVCERIAPGDLRVRVSHHGRRRTLTLRLYRPCPGAVVSTTSPGSFNLVRGFRWDRSGRVIPGLRFGADGVAGSVWIDAVGRRDWIRVYRLDAFWSGRRTLRRWLRVRHRYTPARRVYDDSDTFDFACEETSGEEGPPIHKDRRGYYCVDPATHETQSRVLTELPKVNVD
jgi:hypothetical protein